LRTEESPRKIRIAPQRKRERRTRKEGVASDVALREKQMGSTGEEPKTATMKEERGSRRHRTEHNCWPTSKGLWKGKRVPGG